MRLGMAPGAPDGWAAIHVKPQIPCFILLSSRFVCVGVMTGIFIGGFSEVRWFRIIPSLGFALSFLFNTGMFWRLGPVWAPTRIHNTFRAIAVVFLALIAIPSFVGPASMTPFGSRTYTILVGSFGLWLMILGTQLGAAKQNLFPEPLKTLGPPLVNSVWNTVRVLDPVTDMSLINIVLNQVCPSSNMFAVSSTRAVFPRLVQVWPRLQPPCV